MARRTSALENTFLPSGAIDQARLSPFGSQSNSVFSSPSLHAPRSVPANIPPLHATTRTYSNAYLSSVTQRSATPLSPPKTRSTSAEESAAARIEDWRAYTAKLREQSKGEIAHMVADRARLEEVMVEERALWDMERTDLQERLKQLEENNKRLQDELASKNAIIAASGALNYHSDILSPQPIPSHPASRSKLHSPTLTSLQVTSPPEVPSRDSAMSLRSVPQESGRDSDGVPCWAPKPQNPSRTFENENTLRVGDISIPRETPIRVASNELKQTDFGLTTPENAPSRDSSNEAHESIDISQIQPDLEGVLIKATALFPKFAARVLSPQITSPPEKISSGSVSPRNILASNGHDGQTTSELPKATLGVIGIDENRRRTLHAGHTPNHSISNIKIDLEKPEAVDSNTPTPTQARESHQLSISEDVEQFDGTLDEDPALTGPLGLTNDSHTDSFFLEELTSKLQEVRNSAPQSPSELSLKDGEAADCLGKLDTTDRPSSETKNEDPHINSEVQSDDGPPLRLKPSTNFGRPLGQL